MAKKPVTNPSALYRIERQLTPKAQRAYAAAVAKWKQDVAKGKPPSYEALKPLAKVTEDGLRLAGISVAQSTSQALGIKLDFNLKNPQAVKWAKANSARLIKDVTDETRAAVRAATTRAVGGEMTVGKLGKYVREIVGLTEKQEMAVWNAYERAIEQGFSDADALDEANAYGEKLRRYRSEVIARTEILRAENRGQELVWEQGKASGALEGLVREWIATADELTCDICGEMNGQTTPIGEPWETSDGDELMTPQDSHPQCLHGEMLVRGPQPLGLTQRWHDGDLCIIRTAGGQELAVTPNHPVLGRKGWIASHLIRMGDDLVGQSRPDGELAIDHHEYHRPTAIQDIARAFRQTLGMTSVEVPLTAEDFHGDAIDGEVAVIWANRRLLTHGASSRLQRVEQNDFQRTRVVRPRLCRACVSRLVRERLWNASRGLMRGLDLFRPSAWRHLLPLHALGIRPATRRNAGPSQAQIDTASHDAIAFRDALDRRPLSIVAQHHLPYQRVVEVKPATHRGLVWNMETAHGIYLAQGILCHNCRCSQGLVEAT